jgi:pyruvate kinase
MIKITIRTEDDIDYVKRFVQREQLDHLDVTDAISRATVTIAHDLDAKMIVTVTTSGRTARMISRFRPQCHIMGCTTDPVVCRQLNMAWGIKPLLIAVEHDTFELFDHALQAVEKASYLQKGDLTVMTAGIPLGITGSTNIIKVKTVGVIE